MSETPHRSVPVLERELAGDAVPPPLDLHRVRTDGARRRRGRWAAAGAGAALTLGAAAVVATTVLPPGGSDGGPDVASEPPRELSALAQRALEEVPGAVQVSSWQVVLPEPDGARGMFTQGDDVPSANLVTGPVDVGLRSYEGVTGYRPGTFPDWLRQGVAQAEKDSVDDPSEGYPVGSTDMGIIVDAGPIGLSCLTPLPQWDEDGGPDRSDGGCSPAMVSGEPGDYGYQWGMGAPGFLKAGRPLQLFEDETYVAGREQSVWIGGTDGTDVASVDLVLTDGSVVPATVSSDDVVPGETMFWATVDGELAQVVTRDADGDVLERHDVQPCDDPVDCEVR